MLTHQLLAIAVPTLTRSFRRWIFNLGALGFIPLGLLDSSFIPLPGSMDVLTIILSAQRADLWLFYAVMATIQASCLSASGIAAAAVVGAICTLTPLCNC